MLKTLIGASSALALSFAAMPAVAQTAPAPAAQPAPVATVDADPALWVVKDADTTIYLFGTIHILKPGLGWFDEAVKTAFDKSDTLVLEMVEPDQATMQQLVLKMAINMSGPPLTQQLPEDKRAAFAAAVSGLGAPPTALDQFEPWFAALTLTVAQLPKYGYDPNSGVEKVVTAAAKAAGKPIEGLETVEQQLGYFDNLPQSSQLKYLSVTLDQLPEMGPLLDKMVTSWSGGQPDTLATLINDGMDETPEIARILLNDRNARWAEWIEKRLATPGTVFVAVGAGHLAGADSVQAKLALHKLKATRVEY